MPDFPLLSGGAVLDYASTPATSRGITLTAGAVAHVEGATWTELIASTSAPATWMLVALSSRAVGRYFVDIGIGASTAEKVVVADLFSEMVVSNEERDRCYLLPVGVPASSRISARVQSSAVSGPVDVTLHLVTGTMKYPDTGTVVESMGLTAATTRPFAVDPGAVINTWGAWVELTASTPFPIFWLVVAMGHGANLTGLSGSHLVDIGVGAAGSEKRVIPNISTEGATAVDTHPNVPFYPTCIPAGSRLAVRASATVTTATSRIIDVCVYGVA